MKNADSPVYPFTYSSSNEDGDITEVTFPGVSKREYYAGLAIQGILANPYAYRSETLDIAKTAVDFADKLLKALEE